MEQERFKGMNKFKNRTAVQKTLKSKAGNFTIYDLTQLPKLGLLDCGHLPYSIKVLLESALRNFDDFQVTFADIKKIAGWTPKSTAAQEIAFKPGRVILQDFTGVPCVVDLAAMREAMKSLGGDYKKINPQVRCDLVIDHSVQVDAFGSPEAFQINISKEFERNQERYEFLKWGQKAFQNFGVVPPGTGIVHQVNLEYLASGVLQKNRDGKIEVFPDSLVGTDSHTTMINGLGVVGWGVGGIEAEAVMLGEPIYMLLPQVVGFHLRGSLAEGVTATDLVLTVTQTLRKKGVVDKFVEFYGEGLQSLTLPDRATISNMAPEYGATIGIFPVDEETLRYYRMTGRSEAQVDLVERYMKEQGMFYNAKSQTPQFSEVLELDLSMVKRCLAGPKRPQDRVAMSDLKTDFNQSLVAAVEKRGFGLSAEETKKTVQFKNGQVTTIGHGAVVISAITSCTNTSNPSVLIGAGLLAKKAVERGLKVPSYVKTSLAPGSQVVEEYLKAAGLMPYLEKLGFHIIGYGCTTCIGNSGPLPDHVAKAIQEGDLVAASVLSGNRNFEGRVNPLTKANYLASPLLVVAYALAGRVDIDLSTEPIAVNASGEKVYLDEIWPSRKEIKSLIDQNVTVEAFRKRYQHVTEGTDNWNKIKSASGDLYDWKKESSYIQQPPFFTGMKKEAGKIKAIKNGRVLVKLGDSITTDHISPAGAIAKDSPAGKYLIEIGVEAKDFNSYGSRRGNDRVMTRGTFANIRLRNQLAPGTEGSWTIHFPSQKKTSIFDAAQEYQKQGIALIVIAGKEYGTGSSRDWAAKGAALLGVRVVIAESYERIHRSNLAGMGILPLEFSDGQSAQNLGLKGDEVFDFEGISEGMKPADQIKVTAKRADGSTLEFSCKSRLDTPVEIDYFRNGGILQTVIRKLL